MNDVATIALSGHELAVYLKVALYAMALDALLAALGAAFGPFVQRYFPRAYTPLAMLGGAVRSLLNSLEQAARAFSTKSLPPSERPTPVDPMRPPPPRGRGGFARVVVLALASALALCVALGAALSGCGPSQRHVAHVAVVGLGSALGKLHAAHERAYVRATDAARDAVVAEHGSLADYDQRVLAINVVFDHRSEALVALDADLYTAAAVVDATAGGGAAAYMPAACRLVTSLDTHLAALADGAVLPAVAVPPEITQAVGTLRLLAGRCEVRHAQ